MALILFIKFQFKLLPISSIIERVYDDLFYSRMKLPDLSQKPILIINSTNLQSGRLFYFTRESISDSTYDNMYEGGWRKVFKHEAFPVAKAVMCSSSVPSFFTPIEIAKELLVDPIVDKKINPVLVDGGVYDNQGIHKITHPGGQFECKIVIVSDAGNLLPFSGSFNRNIFTLLMRTVEVLMNRIKMFQMMTNLYQNKNGRGREIAYITLGWEIESLISGFIKNLRNGNIVDFVRNTHGLTDEFIAGKTDREIEEHITIRIGFSDIKCRLPSPEQVSIARSVATNLTALSREEIDALGLYAEVMTEVQVKLYCPGII